MQIKLITIKLPQWQLYSAKETYDFKEPTNRSHPIPATVEARNGSGNLMQIKLMTTRDICRLKLAQLLFIVARAQFFGALCGRGGTACARRTVSCGLVVEIRLQCVAVCCSGTMTRFRPATIKITGVAGCEVLRSRSAWATCITELVTDAEVFAPKKSVIPATHFEGPSLCRCSCFCFVFIQCVAVRYSAVQCVAVRGSMCCSALQCIAVYFAVSVVGCCSV